MSKQKSEYGLGWIYQKTQGTRISLAVFSVLVIANTIITLSVAYFLKMFVDIATGDIKESLLFVGLIAISVIFAGGVITMINSVLVKCILGKTERNLRLELMDIILSRRLLDISKQHTGELLTKLTADIEAVSNCFINIIKNMIGGLASAVLATVALFLLNWKMAAIMLVLTPVLMVVMSVFSPFMQTASTLDKKYDEANRSLMQENLSRIMLIKAYFMRSTTITKIRSVYSQKLKSGMKMGMWVGVMSFSATLVANAMFMVVLGVGAYFVLNGETTVGSLIAIVQLLNYIVNPVANFAGTITQISQSTASAERIGTIYKLPADKEINAIDPVDASELFMKGVSFSYSNDVALLDNINAVFSKGSITGIVGKSGSGKSTLLKLLIGLYSPHNGRVGLRHSGGVVYGEEIMPQVSYVPPTDYLFSGTVTENIVMADDNSDKNAVLKNMEIAAEQANIISFIRNLTLGFDADIGESGGTVSSGQAQRIAIARAIYKKSPVVIFDEPTANLDVESVSKFQTTVKILSKDKICVIVTHESSTVDICDKVYVIEEGALREKAKNEVLDFSK